MSAPNIQDPPDYQSKRWFYQNDSEDQGPINYSDLRYLAMEGKISGETLIWTSSDPERKPARGINNLLPRRKEIQEVKSGWDAKEDRPPSQYKEAKRRTIMDGPPGGLYLPYLKPAVFSKLLGALALGGFLLNVSEGLEALETKLPFLSLGVISLMIAISLAAVYLHRTWEMLRVVGASLSGRKAVTLMAFPIFNAIASFPVIYGWSGFWNYQVRTHPGFSTTTKVFRPLYLLFCLSFLIAQTVTLYQISAGHLHNFPPLGQEAIIIMWGATFALGLVVWRGFCNKINFLAKKKS